jgi:hypothetical protein
MALPSRRREAPERNQFRFVSSFTDWFSTD